MLAKHTLACFVSLILAALSLSILGCAMSSDYHAPDMRQASGIRFVGERNEAAFDRAVELVAQLRYEEAAGEFLPLIEMFEEDGKNNRAAETMFWLAYCSEKQDQKTKAVRLYKELVRKYPDAPASRNASDRLSRLP